MQMVQRFSLCAAVMTAAALLSACSSPSQAQPKVSKEDVLLINAKSLNGQLLDAARTGDADKVQQLLAQGAEVDAHEWLLTDTPLLLAVRGNHVPVARLLLMNGANPNFQNVIDDSAFLLAGALGRTELVRLMLSHGANLKITNRFGGTALIPACERGHVQTVQVLIAAGVDVNHVNRLGWTCLMEAVVLSQVGPEHQAIIRALIEAKADLNLPDKNGVTALAHARQRNQTEVVHLLQAAGAR
ncbi:ankyrin repeat domain-containing protein [Comamonas sp. Y33R10-2]|uniref:ankyrin repeat domain-containing protein n=1 Tax=Comamonas sp. Y33R10-2 TaxID=2853257 RepID=UPI001C5CAE23|nr:ankyrin repeat domain-containing protein [Comamonas sp. Y33R10-2]QXZ10583.1 ankyrin repeat domain-containing protein [Comamonas sp. Y33R10-2]